jgi:hypothetical protein
MLLVFFLITCQQQQQVEKTKFAMFNIRAKGKEKSLRGISSLSSFIMFLCSGFSL